MAIISSLTATTPPSSSMSRTPGAPVSFLKSPRMPCRSSRWFRRTSRPNMAARWAAWSIPSLAAARTSAWHRVLVLSQPGFRSAGRVRRASILPTSRTQAAPVSADPSSKTNCSTSSMAILRHRNNPAEWTASSRQESWIPPIKYGSAAARRLPRPSVPLLIGCCRVSSAQLPRSADSGSWLWQNRLSPFGSQHFQRQFQLHALAFAQWHPADDPTRPAALRSTATAMIRGARARRKAQLDIRSQLQFRERVSLWLDDRSRER